MNDITLTEEQTYAHVYVVIPSQMTWGHVQVKADDEGIVVDIFDKNGEGVATTYAFYAELFDEGD